MRRQKRTKILATLGPATSSQKIIKKLAKAGADAFRINMSHGDHEQWRMLIKNVRTVAPHAAIVMDTRGPELRILGITQDFALTPDDELVISLKKHKKMPYLSHSVTVKKGSPILLDDGAMSGVISGVEDSIIRVRITDGGILTDRRKVTLPNAQTNFPILDKKDKEDIEFCRRIGADAIALSFTRNAKDLKQARRAVGDDILIVAKIENEEGVDHLHEIIDGADGIMIARGDLGVEIPLEDVPVLQKKIIRMCNQHAKPVIVATQMLESMTVSNRPTRAEASDVANAIIDGADCVMLSGETAMGRYPVEAVATMNRIALVTDPTLQTNLPRISPSKLTVAEAISNAVFDLAENLNIDAIVTATSSGFTARMVARFRPHAPIIGVAHDVRTQRQLQLTWGVTPAMFESHSGNARLTILHAVETAVGRKHLTRSHDIIATAGVDTKQKGSTNLIEVHNVGDLLDAHKKK